MTSIGALIANSVLLGAGLAMDAFSVSLVNGLKEPHMKGSRMATIAGVFAGFQTAMPMIGWICVKTILELFTGAQRFVPWIGFGLLLFIGGKMIYEGIRGSEAAEEQQTGTGGLLLQGVATSIDALSVGFTMAEMQWGEALAESIIIGAVTFGICLGGIFIGRKAGTKISGKANILGGIILIGIGIEILVTHLV